MSVDDPVSLPRAKCDKTVTPLRTALVHDLPLVVGDWIQLMLSDCESCSSVENHSGRLWAVPHDGPGTTVQLHWRLVLKKKGP